MTRWVNEELLYGSQLKISSKFVGNNSNIMDGLDTCAPQLVEELRVEACVYENFIEFFGRLKTLYDTHNFDTDLIINVDETTTNAEKCKKSTTVLFDPTLDIRPVAVVEPKVEHITLCCAISASGNSLRPVFIIKNKSCFVETDLNYVLFDYGDSAVGSNHNGWQDAVSILFILLLFIYLREHFCNGSQKF